MSRQDAYAREFARFRKAFGVNVRRLRQAGDGACAPGRCWPSGRLHRTEVRKIEQGIVEPKLSTLLILADALGATLDEMVAGLGVPKRRRPPPSTRAGDSSYRHTAAGP